MAPRGTRARLAGAQTTTDLELSSPRNDLDFLIDRDQPNAAHVKDREYVPPDGGYGWICVACVFLVNAHTWGLNFCVCGRLHHLRSICTRLLFVWAFSNSADKT